MAQRAMPPPAADTTQTTMTLLIAPARCTGDEPIGQRDDGAITAAAFPEVVVTIQADAAKERCPAIRPSTYLAHLQLDLLRCVLAHDPRSCSVSRTT